MAEPTKGLPPGWISQTDPAKLREEYKWYALNHPGTTFEQYQGMVKDANPDDRPRKPSATQRDSSGNPVMVPVTDEDLRNAAADGYDVGVEVPKPYEQTGQDILDATRERNAKQLETYGKGAGEALGGLQSANQSATQQTSDAIRALEQSGGATKDQIQQLLDGLGGKLQSTDKRADASLKNVTGAYDQFRDERDASTKQYLDELAPLQQKLTAQGYEGVQTSADDIGRLIDSYGKLNDNYQHGADKLNDVYGRYEDISSPEMTAKERAILDAAQRSFAMKDKSARDALTRELQAQGAYSGGNLITQQAAAQQVLGNERVAATIQAQGSAVDRALQGLAGMRGTAGDIASQRNTAGSALMEGANQIRTGNDAMAQFNKNQQGITQRFQDEYAQSEQERLQRLAQAKQDTMLNKTTGDFDASSQLNRDTQDSLDRAFGRQTQTTNTGLAGAQNKYAVDQGLTAEKTAAANNEANRASNAAGLKLTDTSNQTNLIRSTGQDEDEAQKYLLGLKSEKANLQKLGVRV